MLNLFTIYIKYDKILAIYKNRIGGNYMVKVLIAEDNVPMSVCLSNAINNYKNVQAVSIINEGTGVCRKIKALQPNILLLDMKMPGKNGIQILDEIKDNADMSKLKVVIYSGEQKYIQEAIRYENVVKFLDKGRTSIEDVSLEIKNIAEDIGKKSLDEMVLDRLLKLGFQTKFKGTYLLKDCIVFSLNSKKENMEDVYKSIAYLKNESSHTIKSNVKSAIDSMWKNTNKDLARRYLRLGENDRPSSKNVTTMIKYYIDRV